MNENMTNTNGREKRDLPNPRVRYVVPAAIVHPAAVVEKHVKRLEEIIEGYGKVSIRFEFRYWDPDKHNNTTFPGTICAHFHEIGMVQAVIREMRELIVRGQRMEEEK